MQDSSKKAFDYEKGQYICYIYADLPEDEQVKLEEFIEFLQSKQSCGNSRATQGWASICTSLEIDGRKLHITLLRGHRAIYYHQIRPLVEMIKLEAQTLQPFSLCLDDLKIFENHERNKQFLCLSTRKSSISPLMELKRMLQESVDQFATKLTLEDETEDTLAHCSLMVRDRNEQLGIDNLDSTLKELNELCSSGLEEFPLCLVKINEIHVKIGHYVYNIGLVS